MCPSQTGKPTGRDHFPALFVLLATITKSTLTQVA